METTNVVSHTNSLHFFSTLGFLFSIFFLREMSEDVQLSQCHGILVQNHILA